MIRNDEQWLAIADLFARAALDDDWPTALNALADVCGDGAGQLIAVGPDDTLPFNWVTRFDPKWLAEFEASGLANPAFNPRVAQGIRMPVMSAWHEARCSSEEELRRNFAYADFCRRSDIPHGSQTTLLRENGMLIGLAVLQGAAHGVPQEAERRAFDAIAPHVRSAVMTQMALERQGASLIGGAMEALSIAAFLCDRDGIVRAMTSAAENALSSEILRLTHGRLGAPRAEDARALEAAIAAAAAPPSPRRPAHRTLIVRRGDGAGAIQALDIVALPNRQYAFGFEPRVLVSVRGGARRGDEMAALLAAAFSMTAMEAKIAVRLAEGQPREVIAAERQVSVETVRSHIKKIFAKMDVRREAELAARLRQLS